MDTSIPSITIRLLDLDGKRLSGAEQLLRHGLKTRGIQATIHCVSCGLEIARSGFSGLTPALTMNQFTVSVGEPLTPETVEAFCDKLVKWIEMRQNVTRS